MIYKNNIGPALKSKFEELDERPDDIVWTNIENKLRKKKRRRFFIFWLIAGLVMLSTTGLLIFKNQTIDSDSKSRAIPAQVLNNEASAKKENAVTNIKPANTFNSKQDNQLRFDNIKKDKHTTKKSSRVNYKININDIKKTSEKTNEVNRISNNENSLSIKHLENTTKNSTKKTNQTIVNDSLEATVVADEKSTVKKYEPLKKTDSIHKEDTSRWSFTPHVLGSNYGVLNAKTNDIFSVNYGILASYKMTKTSYVRLGFRRLDLKQSIDSISNKVQYLEFPLEFKYAPFNKKINPYLTGGISYFVLQNSSSNITNNTNYRATIGTNLGLGIETKIFKNVLLNFEGNFTYQLKPFTDSNDLKPFIFSIQTGIEYRFRKTKQK